MTRQDMHDKVDFGSRSERSRPGDRRGRRAEPAQRPAIPPVLVELAYYLRAIRYGRGRPFETRRPLPDD